MCVRMTAMIGIVGLLMTVTAVAEEESYGKCIQYADDSGVTDENACACFVGELEKQPDLVEEYLSIDSSDWEALASDELKAASAACF